MTVRSDNDRAILPFPADREGQEALVRQRFLATKPPPVVIRAMALRLAKRCSELVGDFVPANSRADVDEVFFYVIEEGLKEFRMGHLAP